MASSASITRNDDPSKMSKYPKFKVILVGKTLINYHYWIVDTNLWCERVVKKLQTNQIQRIITNMQCIYLLQRLLGLLIAIFIHIHHLLISFSSKHLSLFHIFHRFSAFSDNWSSKNSSIHHYITTIPYWIFFLLKALKLPQLFLWKNL